MHRMHLVGVLRGRVGEGEHERVRVDTITETSIVVTAKVSTSAYE